MLKSENILKVLNGKPTIISTRNILSQLGWNNPQLIGDLLICLRLTVGDLPPTVTYNENPVEKFGQPAKVATHY